MAKYTGYVVIPHNTYLAWRTATNGNGYDVDNSYGCQCWDLAAEFWYNVGFPQGYPTTAGTHAAYGVWDDRVQNAGDEFDLILDKTQIKTGDIIVFNYFTGNPYGHIGFADEDYNGTDNLQILSENNGGTPDPAGGAYTNINNYNLAYFRGAFRYHGWIQPSPTPDAHEKTHFKWVLYAKKLKQMRNQV